MSEQPEIAGQGSKSGPPLPPGSLLGFGFAVLAVLLVGVFSYRSLQERGRSADLVAQTYRVVGQFDGLLSSLKDAETGQRGFLLTGDESYLEPYTRARAVMSSEVAAIRVLMRDDDRRLRRLNTFERLNASKMEELAQTIALRRAGKTAEALAIVRSERGRVAMDTIRESLEELQGQEEETLQARRAEWEAASTVSVLVTTGGSLVLVLLIFAGAVKASHDHRARERQIWMRVGQMALSAKLQGEQRLETLGENALTFLAQYLGAQVGAIYLAQSDGNFRRFAGYALAPTPAQQPDHEAPPGLRPQSVLRPGDGLAGQAAKEGQTLHVRQVPAGYLTVASSLGGSQPRELLIAPARIDGIVQGIIELGFFQPVQPIDRELLDRASESIGISVRTSKDRTRLEELLDETQRQAEELQAQQEELRVSNEELDEQARAAEGVAGPPGAPAGRARADERPARRTGRAARASEGRPRADPGHPRAEGGRAGAIQPVQERVPRQHEPRAAHARSTRR